MNKKQQAFVIFFAVACLGLTIWGLYELLKPKKMVGDKTGWVCDQSKQCTKTGQLGTQGVFGNKEDCDKTCHSADNIYPTSKI